MQKAALSRRWRRLHHDASSGGDFCPIPVEKIRFVSQPRHRQMEKPSIVKGFQCRRRLKKTADYRMAKLPIPALACYRDEYKDQGCGENGKSWQAHLTQPAVAVKVNFLVTVLSCRFCQRARRQGRIGGETGMSARGAVVEATTT